MSSDGNEFSGVVSVYLSGEEVAVLTQRGHMYARTSGHADGIAKCIAYVDAARARARVKVHVSLAASFCRPVRIAALPPSLARAERARAAEASAIAQSGLQPPCRVWLHRREGFSIGPAIVVDETVLTSIERAFAHARLRVARIRPWWAQALEGALRQQPRLRALAIWEGSALTFLGGDGDDFAIAQTMPRVDSEDLAGTAFARALVSASIRTDDALAIKLRLHGDRQRAGEGVGIDGQTPFAAWVEPLRVTW